MAKLIIRYEVKGGRMWDTPEGRMEEVVWNPACFAHAVRFAMGVGDTTIVREITDYRMGECYFCEQAAHPIITYICPVCDQSWVNGQGRHLDWCGPQ